MGRTNFSAFLIAIGLLGQENSVLAQAEACHEQPLYENPCETGFIITSKRSAADFRFPFECQINITREVNVALVRKGYRLDRFGVPPNDLQLYNGSIAAIQCEQRKAGLPVTGHLDRATLKVILNRDIVQERCNAAGYKMNCPLG